MAAVITLLVVLVLSITVVRVASVALTLTGVSQQLARFQARSAFTGTGFTTSESEKIVHHPVRRRIIMMLMLFGNAGTIGAISSLIITFTRVDQERGVWVRVAVLVVGLTALWVLARSQWVDHRMSQVIGWALKKWTSLEVRDYAGLLHLGPDFAVAELQVQPGDWLADQTLAQLRLNDEGILVLGIERADGTYVGAPRGDTFARANDIMVLYGPRTTIADLDRRRAGREGVRGHHKAVERQQQAEAQEGDDGEGAPRQGAETEGIRPA